MHVTSIGDHDDVFDKYQRMLNVSWKEHSNLAPDEAERDELHADAVGLYALVSAGYAPQGLPNNLERIANTHGHNGNFLTDVLDGSNVEGMRIRAARKAALALPQECRARAFASSTDFTAFQKALAARPANPTQPMTPGLSPMELTDAIRPGLNHVRFSPDGKYLLAQH